MAQAPTIQVEVKLPDQMRHLLAGMAELVSLHADLSAHPDLEGDRVVHRTNGGWVDTADAIEAILTKERPTE